ncbi:agmatine deiminase family protein [Marinobacteraceae bacterium S3BR75-40.1]
MQRYLPAEWAPQGAVLLTWPHVGTDWGDKLNSVTPVFDAIALAVLEHENLLVTCEDVFQVDRLQQRFNQWVEEKALPGRARVMLAPANDTWARDHGPITVLEDGRARVLDFQFNAWGGKFPWDKDNAINGHLARQKAFGNTRMETVDLILEGGSIESDGQGTLLTTTTCLLSSTRNPQLDRAGVERALHETLGANRVLWLENGYLAGDDTDSHIDTLARFCAPGRICYVRCDDPEDEHHEALAAMAAELEAFRTAEGEPYELIPLPWPEPIHDEEGQRLPATYANFLIINKAVLLPVYGVPQDAAAVEALQRCFPDRKIVSIDCRPLIEQHGSLHCLTMQIPREVWES